MYISIIIPMRNEQAYVKRCLNSVLSQIEGWVDIEVLCVDGQSNDGTTDIVRQFVRRDNRVQLLNNPGKIVPRAMNLAIVKAKGNVVIRLDCHAEYDHDYIKQCLEVLQETGADNVGGYITTLPGSDTPPGRAIAAASSSPFGVGGSVFRTSGGEQEADTVPFGCFRRDVFDRFGLYDERLVRNQDIEFNSRIRRRGGRIVISPRIHSTYFTRSTFSGLWQQAFNNGMWNLYTLYLVGGGLRPRHFVPAIFVMSMLIFGLGGLVFWPLWLVLSLELLVYLTIGLVVGHKAAQKANISPVLVLLGFIQLHLAYGIGSLWGLVTAPFKFGIHRPIQSALKIHSET